VELWRGAGVSVARTSAAALRRVLPPLDRSSAWSRSV